MKIGILTFHRGTNYGGILQCYALQRVLCNYGHDVEIIDYAPASLPLCKRMCNKLKTVNSVKMLWNVVKIRLLRHNVDRKNETIDAAMRMSKFDEFRHKYMLFSPKLSQKTIGEYSNGHYDAIIVGSDQVWTSLYDSESVYFLGWNPEFKGLRISYAACSAHSFVRGRRKNELADLLAKFSIITVRDRTTAALVENITAKRPPIVPDPTMLYAFKEFLPERRSQDEYILTYILGPEIKGGHINALKKIKAHVGNVPVYSIVTTTTDVVPYSDKILDSASPEEWVRLIAGAKAVYTDSFHAILFSMKFEVPFAGYWCDPVRSSRLIYLRDIYQLPNIVSSAKDINLYSCCQPVIEDNILYKI